MFIKIENSGSTERLLNLDLVEVVEMDIRRKVASVFNGRSIIAGDSAILYRYYSDVKLEEVPEEPVKVEAGA